jgi:hypothetical protein
MSRTTQINDVENFFKEKMTETEGTHETAGA